jgi:UDP-N-acetylmuramoylalanine--D-glutamate ligase
MMEWLDKKVGVLGAGEENTPLIFWLVEQGAKVVVADQKPKETLPTYDQLKVLPVEFRLGTHYLDHLADFEMVFRTPMLPAAHPKLVAARHQGVTISSQTKLFFDLCPAPIIGVTGTKGKGTTSSLIFEMLKEARFDVYLGGNIGTPPITFLSRLTAKSWVVLELSSFQLEDLAKSPHIAVVLDITPDHLDRHKTFLEYLEAKKPIVRHQAPQDFAVLSADNMRVAEFAVETKAQLYFFSATVPVERGAEVKEDCVYLVENKKRLKTIQLSETHLVGRYNLKNMAAAAVAARLAGASYGAIQAGAKKFPGAPHALEFVGEFKGVKFYNDSHATTPAPTIAAVQSFNEPIILILGGSRKKSDFRELGEVITKKSTVKNVILLGNVEAPRMRAAIQLPMNRKAKIDFYPVMSMEAAVETAVRLAKRGDVVLLSPAAASFDLFANYKDRGEKFRQAVKRYGSD